MLGSSRCPHIVTNLLNNQRKTRSTQNIATPKFHTKHTTVLFVKIQALASEKYKYAYIAYTGCSWTYFLFYS